MVRVVEELVVNVSLDDEAFKEIKEELEYLRFFYSESSDYIDGWLWKRLIKESGFEYIRLGKVIPKGYGIDYGNSKR